MKLFIAQLSDAKSLAKYFKQFSLPGPVDLRIHRGQDYFKPYDCQSDQHLTYILKDKSEILGVASFIIKEVLLEGHIQKVALGRDLRISPQRKAVVGWTEHFLPVMEDLQKTLHVKHFFATLNLFEVKTLNAFVRPRKISRPLPRFSLYRRFNLITLHGQFPFLSKNPLPHLRIVRGSKAHEDALVSFVNKKSRQMNLSDDFTPDFFYQKMLRWPGLNLSDFLIAFDSQENIVGCTAPWSSEGIQDYIPHRYSLKAHNFRQFLKFGSLFGWTRRLTKPLRRTRRELPFKFKQLLFLHSNNADIFEALLWRAYEESREDEFLAYLQLRSNQTFRRPSTWVTSKTPYGLYALVHPHISPPAYLHPQFETPVQMEPFYL
jgi:hypothetical protein